MNKKEQLEDLRRILGALNSPFGDVRKYKQLIDQLIAERPYEPGEPVMHNGEVCYFYCVSPFNGCIYIVCLPNGDTVPVLAENVKPPPKTTRLKPVPEEVMRDARWAQSISPADDIHDAAGKARAQSSVCEYLTNPDNWEE